MAWSGERHKCIFETYFWQVTTDGTVTHMGRDLNLAETPVTPVMQLTSNVYRVIRIFSMYVLRRNLAF